MKIVDKGKYEFKKGMKMHLDHIYEIQGLLPSGTWESQMEQGESEDIHGDCDDTVIFLKDVTIEYKVKM